MKRPVVLLHGWGGTFASTFVANGWLRRLASEAREVVPVDLPGHADLKASHDPTAYADLTAAIISKLPTEPADIVGFSLGGKLALSLAVRAPDRVGKLVIGGVGNNLFSPEPGAETLAHVLEHEIESSTPASIAVFVRYALVGGNHPKALAAVLRRPANPTLGAEDLVRLLSPILLVNGDRDTIAYPDDRLRSALPGAHYQRLADVDHLALPDNVAFQDAAACFLAALD